MDDCKKLNETKLHEKEVFYINLNLEDITCRLQNICSFL